MNEIKQNENDYKIVIMANYYEDVIEIKVPIKYFDNGGALTREGDKFVLSRGCFTFVKNILD